MYSLSNGGTTLCYLVSFPCVSNTILLNVCKLEYEALIKCHIRRNGLLLLNKLRCWLFLPRLVLRCVPPLLGSLIIYDCWLLKSPQKAVRLYNTELHKDRQPAPVFDEMQYWWISSCNKSMATFLGPCLCWHLHFCGGCTSDTRASGQRQFRVTQQD